MRLRLWIYGSLMADSDDDDVVRSRQAPCDSGKGGPTSMSTTPDRLAVFWKSVLSAGSARSCSACSP